MSIRFHLTYEGIERESFLTQYKQKYAFIYALGLGLMAHQHT